ncbi:MAG: ankyrin repeat domain-containing protein [Candidatus Omnitrophica bacterium]|nr:ankyrin repeat domain-containing protein [Candidatus Omnitrophota bacterium]
MKNRFVLLSLGFKLDDEDFRKYESYQHPQVWSGTALLKILDRLSEDHPIDKTQLYLIGMSAGAQYVVRFALWRPPSCRAVAAHAAGAYDLPAGYVPVRFLITVGSRDKSYRLEGAQNFEYYCRLNKIPAKLEIIPNLGHAFTQRQGEMSRQFFAEVREAWTDRIAVRSAPTDFSKGLIEAVRNNDLDTVRGLVSQGGDVNTRTPMGYSLLMEAASLGYTEMVLYLLDHGGRPDVTAEDGETALSLAVKNYRPEIAEILKKAEKIR